MGLYCYPVGRAKPGFEAEWRAWVERFFFVDEEDPTEAEVQRFLDISVMPYASVGAPQVGSDPKADQWIVENAKDKSKTRSEILEIYRGFYILELVENCHGLPHYGAYGTNLHLSAFDRYLSHDGTCLQGSFFRHCERYVGEDTCCLPWVSMWPALAVEYGEHLLELVAQKVELIADAARRDEESNASSTNSSGARSEGQAKRDDDFDVFHFLEAAGKWYVYWGSRGHPIFASV